MTSSGSVEQASSFDADDGSLRRAAASTSSRDPLESPFAPPRVARQGLQAYIASVGLVCLATGAGFGLSAFGLTDGIMMMYLLAVLLAAIGLGRGPAAFAAVLGVTAHAYFFVAPLFSLAITDVTSLLTLATMLVVSIAVSTLTDRLRTAGELAQRRARHADALRGLSRDFSRRRGRDTLLRLAAEHAAIEFGARAFVVTTQDGGEVDSAVTATGAAELSGEARAVVRAIASPSALRVDPNAVVRAGGVVATPIDGPEGPVGALVVHLPSESAPFSRESARLLEGFARLTSEALERNRLAEQAERADIEARTERLRNALLSSVSHDFRTPLAVILGAASHLAERGSSLDDATRTELARTAEREAGRLDRLVGDLLSMTRLDAGVVQVKKEWQPLEDVVGAALRRLATALADRPVTVDLPADLPLVPLDALLIEQVLVNLLDNAVKHTPAGVAVEVAARAREGEVAVEVRDRGRGLKSGDEEVVFEKFRRGGRSSGVGLGLAVCRGIIGVHGGTIVAENRSDGGVAFRFTLPLVGKPPSLPPSEATAPETSARR